MNTHKGLAQIPLQSSHLKGIEKTPNTGNTMGMIYIYRTL